MSSQIDWPLLAHLTLTKRQSESLTTREAAKAIGISASTVSRIERGSVTDMSLSNFLALCDWLTVELDVVILSGEPGRSGVVERLEQIEADLARIMIDLKEIL